MQSGKIIQRVKIKDGQEIDLRLPHLDDAERMLKYINTLSKEKTFILMQGEQLTLEEEIEFLTTLLKKMEQKKALLILASKGDAIVGVGQIRMQDKIYKHIGGVGLSVSKEYRNQGLGTLLLEQLMQQAVDNLPELEMFVLKVFANNPAGVQVYRKLGFIECGTIPKGIKSNDSYQDEIIMYKSINTD